MRVAILDDYLDVVKTIADWDRLPAGTEVVSFTDHVTGEDALAERLADFDFIVATRQRTPLPGSLIGRLPKLKMIVIGQRHNRLIDADAARARGILVTGTAAYGAATAELAWGLIISLFRHIPWEDDAIRAGKWAYGLGRTLSDKTIGLVGLGRIGGQMAAIAQVFNMDVVAWSQNLTRARTDELGVELVSKEDLFRRADVVSIHMTLSGRTVGLVDKAELDLMKPEAYLVNTSRGPIVDDAALIEALEKNRIAGAAMDVFDEEPLPPDHPYRRMDNIIVTPHIGYVTEESFRAYYGSAMENILAFLEGRDVPRVLDGKA